jgi:hypothetical protein
VEYVHTARIRRIVSAAIHKSDTRATIHSSAVRLSVAPRSERVGIVLHHTCSVCAHLRRFLEISERHILQFYALGLGIPVLGDQIYIAGLLKVREKLRWVAPG